MLIDVQCRRDPGLPGANETPPFYERKSNPVFGKQCLPGSLTGAVSCKRVTQECKGLLAPDGNRSVSAKVNVGLTVRLTSRADAKAGLSDPLVEYGIARA